MKSLELVLVLILELVAGALELVLVLILELVAGDKICSWMLVKGLPQQCPWLH